MGGGKTLDLWDKVLGDKTVGDKMLGGKKLGSKMLPTHKQMQKLHSFKFQFPPEVCFSDTLLAIFKVYTIVYNSADKFSTSLKTFSSGRVFRPSIDQGVSPPVL